MTQQPIFWKKPKTERPRKQLLYKRRQDEIRNGGISEAQYPTAEGEIPRVTLKKGVLKVEGVEVDEYKTPQSLS